MNIRMCQPATAERRCMPFSIRIMKGMLLTALMLCIIITQTGCGEKEPPSKTDFCLDTSCEITLYDDMDAAEAETILNDAFGEIRRYEQLLSKTMEGSDIDSINHAGGEWTAVSGEAAEVIQMANTVSHQSGGAFDITIGVITDLWDFKSETPQVPEDEAIREALPTVDYRKIAIDGERIRLTDENARIDLGGVAKGYIADRTADFMKQQGVDSAVINLGGNVVAIGQKEEGMPWKIGIERPFTDRTEIIGTIQVTDATVVTSGIYERNFKQDGMLYHHILDPATGYPAKTDLEAVTITAAKGNSGFCDAVSTACLVLGKEKALAFIASLQEQYPEKALEAALIDDKGEIQQTEGMSIQFIEE